MADADEMKMEADVEGKRNAAFAKTLEPHKVYEEGKFRRYDLIAKINAAGFFMSTFRDISVDPRLIAGGMIVINALLFAEMWFSSLIYYCLYGFFRLRGRLVLLCGAGALIVCWVLLLMNLRSPR